MNDTKIKVLINNQWSKMPFSSLKVGSNDFVFDAGLYETIRTLNFKPVFLYPHLDRLFKTAKEINLPIEFSKIDIENMLNKVIQSFPDPNQRARILAVPTQVVVYTSHLNLDPTIYNGVSAITVQTNRERPEIKTTNYHTCLTAWEKANNQGCFEAIIIDENQFFYEGTRSNVFWVKEDQLFTRHHDVLPGTTRQTIASKSPFPVLDGHLNANKIHTIQELFLTNSGSGIIPVTNLNQQPIGNGSVGPMTQQLMELYTEWMIQDCEG